MDKPVYTYILLCQNKALYTGWAKNVKLRYNHHLKGIGSRYTRLNKPEKIVYWKTEKNQSAALKKELEIKRKNKLQKFNLIRNSTSRHKLPAIFNNYNYLSIAPGRVNIIGEHIDYNGGKVLPAAINRFVYLGANSLDNQMIRLRALDYDQEVTIESDKFAKNKDFFQPDLPDWAKIPAGIIWSAVNHDLPISGFESIYTSTIPIGAGLSSSAAVQVAFAALFREMWDWPISNTNLAKICLNAENEYLGVKSGMMDQLVSIQGLENSLVWFDSSNNNFGLLPFSDHASLVVANSMMERSLANSAYNDRKSTCQDALKKIQVLKPGIEYLCQLTPQDILKIQELLSRKELMRVTHVVNENERVRLAMDAFNRDDIYEVGKLMNQSHDSLRDLYQVSTPQLDLLVEIAKDLPGCYGSRLTGAGFGGCTVSIVNKADINKFINGLQQKYKQVSGKDIDVFECAISDGVKVEWVDLEFKKSLLL